MLLFYIVVKGCWRLVDCRCSSSHLAFCKSGLAHSFVSAGNCTSQLVVPVKFLFVRHVWNSIVLTIWVDRYLTNTIYSFTRTPDVQFSRSARKQKFIEIRSNSNELAKRSVKARYFFVLSANLHSELLVLVIRSISMELDKPCTK